MPRNRSLERWQLYLTNQLTAFQMHSSFRAKLKNAAPKVSQLVFLWELKIYIYLNKHWLSFSPAEPMLLVCLRREGTQGQTGDPMLQSSAPCSTCPFWTRFYCSASPFSSKNQLVASEFSRWFWWGVNNSKERALVVFQRKLLSDGKDCVCNWEAGEGLMGAGLRKSRNSPKLKQFRRAPNRHRAEV